MSHQYGEENDTHLIEELQHEHPHGSRVNDIDYRCDICHIPTWNDENPLVQCDKCLIWVHRDCYGCPLTIKIPDDEWLCDRCENNEQHMACALCPQLEGAMKRTTDWKWAHLSCAMWIPETFFRMPDSLEPIDCLHIPSNRFNKKCYLCGLTNGATLECSVPGCGKRFHITCAMKVDISLEYQQNHNRVDVIVALCEDHTKRSKMSGKKTGKR